MPKIWFWKVMVFKEYTQDTFFFYKEENTRRKLRCQRKKNKENKNSWINIRKPEVAENTHLGEGCDE